MFTGLIREVGKVSGITGSRTSKTLGYKAPKVSSLLKVGDSIAVDGVCQTVTRITSGGFSAIAVEATLAKTTLAEFRPGRPVNLEPSLKISDSLDGHLVQGHVNGIALVTQIIRNGDSRFLKIKVPPELLRDCRPEGSIALNGVSLTIARMGRDSLEINIIPETWKETNLSLVRPGSCLNIETDILHRRPFEEKLQKKRITQEVLRSWGY